MTVYRFDTHITKRLFEKLLLTSIHDGLLRNCFFESLKAVLINMASILMMSAKLATLGLLKIKVF